MIRNIIFDWSGTLVDDLPAVFAASNYIFEQAGVEPLSLDRFRAEFQLPWAPFYEKYVSHVPVKDLERWFIERYAQVHDTVVPLPHAREFLEFCRGHGIRTFLLSAVMPRLYEAQAAVTGFGGFIDRPYLGVHDKRQRIHDILRENGLDPAETVFIGDMEHDIATAKHGGVRSVAVLTGYNSLDQLRSASPDLIVEHLGELRGLLSRNGLRLRGHDTEANGGAPRRPIATVGALIYNDAGEVLMVRTNKWSGLWGIPGGKIEWGEPSEEALRRELMEETNLEVEDIQFVLVQDAIRPPEFYREAHFLLLNYTCRALPGQRVVLNAEAQDFRWLPLSQCFELPLNTPTRVLLEAVIRSKA